MLEEVAAIVRAATRTIDVAVLVDGADRALLRAKRSGKNQICTAPATRRSSTMGRVRRTTEPRSPADR